MPHTAKAFDLEGAKVIVATSHCGVGKTHMTWEAFLDLMQTRGAVSHRQINPFKKQRVVTNASICVVTFRCLLAAEIIKKYAQQFGVTSYKGMNAERLSALDSVIVVADSVWKIKSSRTYDTLMLDELNMIMERVRVCRHPKRVFAKLVQLVRQSKRVVVMDAYASELALYFLETCCGVPRSRQHWRGSAYSPHRQLKYTVFCDTDDGIAAIHADLKAGKNVVIISGEKAAMQAHLGVLTGIGGLVAGQDEAGAMLTKLAEDCGLGDHEVAAITGDSPQSLKHAFGSDPNAFCKDLRVLAFTSAVLAGNSVDISRFHAVYVMSFGTVLTGQMIGQMMHRIRDITERRVGVLAFKGVWTGYESKAHDAERHQEG